MNLTPITTEIHERHHRFELTDQQIRAVLLSSAVHSLGLDLGANVSALLSMVDGGAQITVTEQLTAAEPISTVHVTTVKHLPALAETVISAPEVSTPSNIEKFNIAPGQVAPIPNAWTPDEDAIAIAACIEMRDQTIMQVAKRSTGRLPGRTWHAINFRLQNGLRDRVAAEREAISRHAAEKAVEPPLVINSAPSHTVLENVEVAPPALPDRRIEPSPRLAVVTDDARPIWHRQLWAGLNGLGYANRWTAADDLLLVKGLTGGRKIVDIAVELEREVADLKIRWNALIGIADDGCGSIEAQQRLSVAVRERAEQHVTDTVAISRGGM